MSASEDLMSYEHKKSEEYRRHRRALDWFTSLSQEEKLARMVKIGILDENHEITERYGGKAKDDDSED